MSAEVFLAAFLGCLFALGVVAIAAYQILKWKTKLALENPAQFRADSMREAGDMADLLGQLKTSNASACTCGDPTCPARFTPAPKGKMVIGLRCDNCGTCVEAEPFPITEIAELGPGGADAELKRRGDALAQKLGWKAIRNADPKTRPLNFCPACAVVRAVAPSPPSQPPAA